MAKASPSVTGAPVTAPTTGSAVPGLPPATVLEIRDQCLCLATQRTARLLARRFDRLFAPLGLTNGQFSLMVALSGDWRPRLGELAAFLAMDHATMTAAIRTLAKRGLVALETDPEDARARRPRLTEAGRAEVARAVPLWRAGHHALAEALPPETRAALPEALRMLAEAAGAEPDPDPDERPTARR